MQCTFYTVCTSIEWCDLLDFSMQLKTKGVLKYTSPKEAKRTPLGEGRDMFDIYTRKDIGPGQT